MQKQKFTYPAVITGQGHSQHTRGKAQHNRRSFNVGKWTRSLISSEDLLPRHGAVTHPAARGTLILIWGGGTRCAPHCPSCLRESRHTPRHLFYPLFYSFSFDCIRSSLWCHEASTHTLRAAPQEGTGGKKKNTSSWKMRTETSFSTWTSLVTCTIYKTKLKMCFSLLTTTAAHVSSDLFQALVLI